MILGMEQIIRRSSDDKAKVASVLLFTDGLANRGIKTLKEIINAMRDPIGSLAKAEVSDGAYNVRHVVSIYLDSLHVTINRFKNHLQSFLLLSQWIACLQALWSV